MDGMCPVPGILEYIVPDFSEKPRENAPARRFFVSKYKWARYAADNNSLKVLHGDKYDKGRIAGHDEHM